jgi:POT family proton-dependent oligopeptide transporter
MTTSFIIIAIAMATSAPIQRLIYSTGPCYEAPLECPASNHGKFPNQVSVWVQTPLYFILAFAEIFGFTTLSEYSYSKAPKDMRSLVQALRQVAAGVGSAFGMALSPVVVNPKILYLYISLALVMALSAPLFWAFFSKYDDVDKELNDLDRMRSDAEDDADGLKIENHSYASPVGNRTDLEEGR